MKPDKFSGEGSFETFLIQFQNCASYNKWSEEDKLAHYAGHSLELQPSYFLGPKKRLMNSW